MSAALHTEASTRIPEDAVHIRSDMDTLYACASAMQVVSCKFILCFFAVSRGFVMRIPFTSRCRYEPTLRDVYHAPRVCVQTVRVGPVRMELWVEVTLRQLRMNNAQGRHGENGRRAKRMLSTTTQGINSINSTAIRGHLGPRINTNTQHAKLRASELQATTPIS